MSKRTDLLLAIGGVLLIPLFLIGWALINRSPADSARAGALATTTATTPTPTPAAKPRRVSEPAPVTLRRTPGRPLKVLVLGDSLRAAYYATTRSRGYPATIVRRINEKRRAVELEPSRVVAGEGYIRAQSTFTLPTGADVSIIEVGTNDVGRTRPEKFRKTYSALVAQVMRASPKTQLFCLSPWRQLEATGNHANGSPNSPSTYISSIIEACQRRNGRFIYIGGAYAVDSFHGPVKRKTFVGPSDKFHPNDAGHRAIASIVLSNMKY